MGTSALLAASRQSFAFARDGALPLTSFLKLDEVGSFLFCFVHIHLLNMFMVDRLINERKLL